MASSANSPLNTVALLAGEASGDILGGSLMHALIARAPELSFEGIGGKQMQAAGLDSLVEMERLSVMGLFEPMQRLPELLRIKRDYVAHFSEHRPALYLGIDSPDFNLRVAKDLHAAGIKTAHYVSPSVWAWRQGRVKGIKQSVDLMLTLFPFEEAFYQQHDMAVSFVGHPLADQLPLESDRSGHRIALQLNENARYVAVLPGSRVGESGRMMPLFLRTMSWLAARETDLQFLIPVASPAIERNVKELLKDHPLTERTSIFSGQSQQVMGAADVVLLASGTSTLEAMLLKTPMVMAYKLSAMTYAIVKNLVRSPYFALPNLLANEKLVPEFIQHEAQADVLGQAVLDQLSGADAQLLQRFDELHRLLRRDASARAADALCSLIGRNSVS